jgi:hypothetical protein
MMLTATTFDATMYQAALRFYGLPEEYERTFTTLVRRDRLTQEPLLDATGKPLSTLVACDSARASMQGQAVWVQVNLPFADLARTKQGRPRKARNEEIEWIMNITLDFEYPAHPPLAHEIGQELAAYLIVMGIAEAGLPIEDSGAGCHLVLPLVPIQTTRATASQWNQAVRWVVKRHIQPRFEQCVAKHGIVLELGGFDSSRVLSVPGTWRPPNPSKGDCPSLRLGYLRRWLPPYTQGWYPTRRESAHLADLVREAYQYLAERREQVSSPTRPGSHSFTPAGDAAVWLVSYAAQKPHEDRSALFQSLVSATYLKYGEDMVLALQKEINRLSGGKYNSRLDTEIQRSLQVAKRLPKEERFVS